MIPSRIIAVGGGKGGVGKSVIAVNLACAMAELGRQVTVLDGDLGMANLHALFGLDGQSPTLHDFLHRRCESLEEVRRQTNIPNLSIIPGSSAHPGDANINHGRKTRLLRHIRRLETEVLIIDVGAGVHFHTIDLFDLADIRVVVSSSQLPAIQNAYGFVKASVHRCIHHAAQTPDQRALFATLREDFQTERLTTLVQRLNHVDPRYGQVIQHALTSFSLQLVGNQFSDKREVDVLHALARMMRDFLGLNPTILGCVQQNARIHKSVTNRTPFMLQKRKDEDSWVFDAMARSILGIEIGRLHRPLLNAALHPGTGAKQQKHQARTKIEHFQRRYKRFVVDLPGRLVAADQQAEVRVTDLSKGGAFFISDIEIETGADVILSIEQGGRTIMSRASICHRRGGGYGVEFESPDQIPLPDTAPDHPYSPLQSEAAWVKAS